MRIHHHTIHTLVLASILWLSACTDVVQIDLAPAEDAFVVDAWLDNRPVTQTIRLTLSQPYFSNAFAPSITDADVRVVRNDGRAFAFDHAGNGNYTWIPQPGDSLGETGMQYLLDIVWHGERYLAGTQMRRVPVIDSIRIENRQGRLGFANGHWAILFARDLPGTGDTYWIKAYKNGVFLNKPNELNIAFDAGFDGGGNVDGIVFITPIRELINRFPDPDTGDDFDTPPYAPGDEVRVEIHSISNEAFFFLETARDQMTNGDNTIFSIPVANTRSNVFRERDNVPALGFFNVSAVSTLSRMVD